MQYKRILVSCLIVILILCSSVLAVSAAEETPFKVTVGVADATPAVLNNGDKFDVSITIDSNPGLNLIKIEVEYDVETVKLVSVTNGEVFEKSSETATYPMIDTETPGLIKFQYVNLGESVTKTGSVMVMQFEAVKEVASKNTVRVIEDQLSGMDATNGIYYGKKFNGPAIEIAGNPESLHNCLDSIEVLPAVAPTCTEKGLSEGKKCTVCGETVVAQNEVDALGHTEETIAAVAPDCTKTGLTEGKKCTVCGETTVAQTVVDALGHKEEIIPAVAPTCTETGLTEGKKCTVCGVTTVEQTVAAALGHTEEVIPAVEPTLKEDGLTEGKKCSVCGEILKAQETVPDKNLTWLWILLGVVAVAGAGVAVYFFAFKKKKAANNAE